SRPESGWDRYHDDVYSADYELGTYHVRLFAADTEVWARPHLDLPNVRIEVIATKLTGPDDNVYGIVCRYQDADNFYFFIISSDGYAGIGVHKNGESVLLGEDTMQPAAVIQTGNTSNLIRAVCDGEKLLLHVNGVLVTSTEETEDWLEGDVGLIVGTFAEPEVEIEFDNFSVTKP
ncbi:MAG: hypothetical protein P8Z41_02815, partial [Anaerolineales bacterium]